MSGWQSQITALDLFRKVFSFSNECGSFSKGVFIFKKIWFFLKGVFIFKKVWFFFERCFHLQKKSGSF